MEGAWSPLQGGLETPADTLQGVLPSQLLEDGAQEAQDTGHTSASKLYLAYPIFQ